MLRFDTFDEAHKGAFEGAVVRLARKSPKPSLVGDVFYAPELEAEWRAEGRARTRANATNGRAGNVELQERRQVIHGSELTADEMGRVGEAVVQLLLPVRAAAVLEDDTDPEADVVLDGLRLDVKASHRRASWAVQRTAVREQRYDGFILLQRVDAGHVRVWASRCPVDGSELGPERPPAKPGQDWFYVIRPEDWSYTKQ